MDFSNPDNRAKVMVLMIIINLFLFIAAIWIESGKMAGTGGVLVPFTGFIIGWTCFAYDEETVEEAQARKAAKKSGTRA